MHRSWLRKTRSGSLYFCFVCFRYVPTISELDIRKTFSEKHPLHWHKAKIYKSVENNFYLFFIQSLIDMTQIFNMIYRWPSFGGPQNTLGLRINWEMSAIFSPVPGWSLLPRCPREVWEKAEERVSLGDVTSHEQRSPWAEAGLFSADPCQYCCCCRRCYCWWCLLSYWGRANSQGRLVTRVVSLQKLICFLCPWISKFTSAFDCNNSCGWSPFK